MALMNIFTVAGSALSAESERLNVTASNLANANSTTGPDGQPYRAKQVVFGVMAIASIASGVLLQVVGWQTINVLAIVVATAAILALAWGSLRPGKATPQPSL